MTNRRQQLRDEILMHRGAAPLSASVEKDITADAEVQALWETHQQVQHWGDAMREEREALAPQRVPLNAYALKRRALARQKQQGLGMRLSRALPWLGSVAAAAVVGIVLWTGPTTQIVTPTKQTNKAVQSALSLDDMIKQMEGELGLASQADMTTQDTEPANLNNASAQEIMKDSNRDEMMAMQLPASDETQDPAPISQQVPGSLSDFQDLLGSEES